MLLKQVLKNIDYKLVQGPTDIGVKAISYDSRDKMQEGLFICIEGYLVDGHKYINSAIENGAQTIIIEKDLKDQFSDSLTIIKVANTRKTMATIAKNFYKDPSSKMELIGVTGTNGKTTITHIINDILKQMSIKTGVIGTIENKIGDKVFKSDKTTPESFDLQRIFNDMYQEDVSHVAMEVSSHALALNRVDGINFKVGVFSNLTQDHLDFHKSFDEYMRAKSKLFHMCQIALINADDLYADKIALNSKAEIYTFGIDKEADFRGSNIKISPSGVYFDLQAQGELYKDIYLPITGKFSVYNALAALAALNLTGINLKEILRLIQNIKGVPGRFQSIANDKGIHVIVDYAHTPDGLENILKTALEFSKADVNLVFGCGGDRDKSKRPIMGEIAGTYAHNTIITSDNPRSEDPEKIINEVEKGILKTKGTYVKITDREEAIKTAILNAKKDDIILISGKGHEDYQILKDKRIHFDDRKMARRYLKEVEINCN